MKRIEFIAEGPSLGINLDTWMDELPINQYYAFHEDELHQFVARVIERAGCEMKQELLDFVQDEILKSRQLTGNAMFRMTDTGAREIVNVATTEAIPRT